MPKYETSIDPLADQDELKQEYLEYQEYGEYLDAAEATEAIEETARERREAKFQLAQAQQEAAEAAANERREALRALYANLSGAIAAALTNYQWFSPVVIEEPVEDTVNGFTSLACFYEGPLDDSVTFVSWVVNRIVAPQKVEFLKRRFTKAVLKGVWSVLKNNMDLAQGRTLDKEARDIAARAWTQFYLLGKVDAITEDKGLVKYFREIGSNQARAWKTDQIRFEDNHISLDDADRFRGFGVDPFSAEAVIPTEQAVHPYYAGPNDNLDGLPPEEPEARKPRKTRQPTKPRRKYTNRPKVEAKPALTSHTGVVVVPRASTASSRAVA